MKKIILGLLVAAVMVLGFAGPASATGGSPLPTTPSPSNKSIEICHYKNDVNGLPRYEKKTITVLEFYTSHKSHGKDIWAKFKYRSAFGKDITVAGQGDASRLAFANCKTPDDDEKIAKPEVIYNDKCGTEDDVFSVAPGRGYTVGRIAYHGAVQTITVTASDDFVFTDGSRKVTYERPLFTDEDCDLPETGVGASYNTPTGYAALGLMSLMGAGMVLQTRRKAGLTE